MVGSVAPEFAQYYCPRDIIVVDMVVARDEMPDFRCICTKCWGEMRVIWQEPYEGWQGGLVAAMVTALWETCYLVTGGNGWMMDGHSSVGDM